MVVSKVDGLHYAASAVVTHGAAVALTMYLTKWTDHLTLSNVI
ncbi:hypothetical protein Z946_1071 [Sulfitobacter noctilucicola]|nr:hypothetical protein Z946_1071 [Sulfitobacter noctilucicola]